MDYAERLGEGVIRRSDSGNRQRNRKYRKYSASNRPGTKQKRATTEEDEGARRGDQLITLAEYEGTIPPPIRWLVVPPHHTANSFSKKALGLIQSRCSPCWKRARV